MGDEPVDHGDSQGGTPRAEWVAVYLDDGDEPIAEYAPPARIQIDTRQLPDGAHQLRVRANDSDGGVGERTIPFEVRNGPAISVEGVGAGDVVDGDLDLLVHAWGDGAAGGWEPERAESPAPIPTWAWVLLIGIVAWALYYGVLYWNPPEPFRTSPTYQRQLEQVEDP